MEHQPREANGQYGTKPAAEVDIDLSPPAPRGSFLFPPVFDTPEEVIDFFENVDVPDDVLVKVSSNYMAAYVHTGSAEADDLPEGWWDDAEVPYRERNGGDTSDEARAEYIAHLNTRWAERPDYVSGADARAAAKVIGMMANTGRLNQAQRDLVNAHIVKTSQGDFTVREVNRDWGLRHFFQTVTNPVTYDQDIKINELRAELALTREQLGEVEDQLEDQIRETRDTFSQRIESTRTDMLDAIEVAL